MTRPCRFVPIASRAGGRDARAEAAYQAVPSVRHGASPRERRELAPERVRIAPCRRSSQRPSSAAIERRSGRRRRGGPRPARGSRRRRPRRTAARPRRAARLASSAAATRCSSPARTCSASAPWPASGSISSGSRRAPISPPSPSRSSPHAARTTASRPRSPRLRSRVSMLPRSGSTESVGSSARSCARRRAEAVPTRMPGTERGGAAERVARILPGGYAPTASPSVSVEVMSLAEWTATSIRPSSSASSSSLTKTPRLPISPNGLRAVAVAGGRDRHERDLDPRPAQRVRGALGLGEREPTSARADAKQHGSDGRCACAGTPQTRRPRGRMRTNAVGTDERQRPPELPHRPCVTCPRPPPQPEQMPHDVSIEQPVRRSRRPPSAAPSAGGGAC